MLAAVERLLCGGDALEAELSQQVRQEIDAVVHVAQLDARAPHEFYAQFGANVFVLLAQRVYSEKIAADLLRRIKPD
ncbi:MAG: hypothetical protein ACK5QH_08770 [Rubrivivax sp.]